MASAAGRADLSRFLGPRWLPESDTQAKDRQNHADQIDDVAKVIFRSEV